jgi:glycine cleavage system H protein
MNFPVDLKYTKDHEWLRVNGESGTIGVTEFAAKELGDVVYMDINTLGDSLDKGSTFGTVEAVKTVSDIYMPVSGEVTEINAALEATPELVNKDPYGEGWMIKIKITHPAELNDLMSADEYSKTVD